MDVFLNVHLHLPQLPEGRAERLDCVVRQMTVHRDVPDYPKLRDQLAVIILELPDREERPGVAVRLPRQPGLPDQREDCFFLREHVMFHFLFHPVETDVEFRKLRMRRAMPPVQSGDELAESRQLSPEIRVMGLYDVIDQFGGRGGAQIRQPVLAIRVQQGRLPGTVIRGFHVGSPLDKS